jgi:hypothetical protein
MPDLWFVPWMAILMLASFVLGGVSVHQMLTGQWLPRRPVRWVTPPIPHSHDLSWVGEVVTYRRVPQPCPLDCPIQGTHHHGWAATTPEDAARCASCDEPSVDCRKRAPAYCCADCYHPELVLPGARDNLA